MLLQATVYVYEDNQEIQGFIGLNAEYIEGIFVSDKMQSQGIGKILLNYVKDQRNKLLLMCIRKIHEQYLFIKEKALRFSAVVLIKIPGKRIMKWYGRRNRNSGLLKK